MDGMKRNNLKSGYFAPPINKDLKIARRKKIPMICCRHRCMTAGLIALSPNAAL